jgi:hypothetical protein
MRIRDDCSMGKAIAVMSEREMAMIIITDILRGKFDIGDKK